MFQSWLWALVGTLIVLAGSSWLIVRRSLSTRSTYSLQRPTGRTYRIRGIPREFDSQRLQAVLNQIFEQHGCNDISFHIGSLAPAASGLDLVATVDFDVNPSVLLSQNLTQWSLHPQSTATSVRPNLDGWLTFDDRFLGFTPLHASPESGAASPSSIVDIVALTGLGGHAFGSFKARNGTYMWLRDELRRRVPASRIWIYGFDSQVAESTSKQTISDLAVTFAANLEKVTRSSSSSSADAETPSAARPLILIGHSLGGLIIKQALINLSKRSQHGSNVLESLCGLLFFGVPNEGIANESLLEMAGNGPNQYLLHTLGPISEVLQAQREDLNRYVDLTDCEIYCFFETKYSPTAIKNEQGKLVVEGPLKELVTRNSATNFCHGDTSRAQLYAINTTHSDLVKFQPHDSDADFIFEVLAQAGREARGLIEGRVAKRHVRSNTENACLRTLSFTGMDYRQQNILPVSSTSGKWLYGHPKYQQWKSSSTAILSIRGDPGVGKSTIMKSIALQSDKNSKVLTLSFFFYGQGCSEQHSAYGMVRSLLHQLVSQRPQISQRLFDTYNERCKTKGTYNDHWTWSMTEIDDIFLQILLVAAKHTQIEIIVDALDESGDQNAVAIAAKLNQILDKGLESGAQLRIVFSCRHFPDICFDSDQEIVVQNHNNQDVEDYIYSSLRQHQGYFTDDFVTELAFEMMKLTTGNFQWTKVVLDQILERRISSGIIKNLSKTISDIPKDLKSLYSHLLEKVRDEDRKDCIKLFQWVAFAVQPLSIHEVQVALILGSDSNIATLSEIKNHKDFIVDQVCLQERIRALSKGLITIDSAQDGSTLRFIHFSVQDYITLHGLSKLQRSSEPILPKAHFQLFQSCLHYLRLNEVHGFCERNCSANGISPSQDYRKEFNFLDYTVANWTMHAKSATRENPNGQEITIQDFAGVSEKAFDAWTRFHYYPWSIHSPSNQTDLLHVLAGVGIETFFSHRKSHEASRLKACDGNGRQPLSWAAENGHLKIVRILLEIGHVDADLPDTHGRTPLWWAVRGGHINIVKLLLSIGEVDIKSFDNDSVTLLWEAIDDGYIDITKLSVNTSRVDINVRDEDGQTPLSEAVSGGYTNIVKLLVETGGVDVEACDKYGQTPLYLAACGGHLDIAKFLVETALFDVDTRDNNGHTPLCEAVYGGHIDIVKLLIETDRVDVDSCDNIGRTPLREAVSSGYGDIVKLLVDTGRVDVDSRDENGQTPLCEASSIGYIDIVKLLVNTGRVDVDSRDDDGRTPLYQAASIGSIDIVKFLVDTGLVDVDSRDKFGQTPLSRAVSKGYIDIVKVLIETGRVDVNSRDDFGRSPCLAAAFRDEIKGLRDFLKLISRNYEALKQTLLIDAAMHGETRMAELIFEIFNLDADHTDEKGRTALSYAAECGHFLTVQLLLSRDDVVVDRADYCNFTPAVYASHAGHDSIVSLLEGKGANLDGCHKFAPCNILERAMDH